MKEYVWLFPLLFIFHDMEEIIGYGIWLKKNQNLLREKYPGILAVYKDFSTEGFSLAVFEEFIVCMIFSILLYFTGNPVLSYIWLGAFIGCTLHFVIHIGQSIVMRQYIPALITSILCLPVSIYVILLCIRQIDGNIICVCIFLTIGICLVAVNLKFAQSLIGIFTRKMKLPPLLSADIPNLHSRDSAKND